MSPSSRALGAAASTARLHLYRLDAVADAGRPRCRAQTNTGHELQTDLPRAAGGEDAFAQPVEMLLAALVGCKAATAHFVARHLWPRPHNRIVRIEFSDVQAARDERGALHLPIHEEVPVSAALLYVQGVVHVRPSSMSISDEDVLALGAIVERRCPVAASLAQGGVKLEFQWRLDRTELTAADTYRGQDRAAELEVANKPKA